MLTYCRFAPSLLSTRTHAKHLQAAPLPRRLAPGRKPAGSFLGAGRRIPNPSQISRLQQSLKDQPIFNPIFATVASSISSDLASAAQDLDSGRLYLSLEKLLQAEDLLWGARTNAEKAEAVKSSYAAFEAEWNTVSQHLS